MMSFRLSITSFLICGFLKSITLIELECLEDRATGAEGSVSEDLRAEFVPESDGDVNFLA